MPDVWTANPEKLRDALKELGAVCGEPARVLKERSPEWTCHVDNSEWLRDLYIHPFSDFFRSDFFICPLIITTCGGVLIGLLLGKLVLYRKNQAQR